MTRYIPLGAYIATQEITSDPFGKLYRALPMELNRTGAHVLLRMFHPGLKPFFKSGLVRRVEADLQGFNAKWPGEAVACETFQKAPLLIQPETPGQTLAQLLSKTQQEQLPLGLDQALAILFGLQSQVLNLHKLGLSHGAISPHSVWISFEGSISLLDAAYAPLLRDWVSQDLELQTALTPYLAQGSATPLAKDAYALGAIFFEMLTLEKWSPFRVDRLNAACQRASGNPDQPLPESFVSVLARLLGLDAPYPSMGELNQALERMIFEGDHTPSTFNTAFFLHTLFRQEFQAAEREREQDLIADFTPYLSQRSETGTVLEKPDRSHVIRWASMAAIAMAAAFGGGLWYLRTKGREAAQFQAEVAALQRELSLSHARMADISVQEQTAMLRAQELRQQVANTTNAEEKDRIQKLLDEEKKKLQTINQQREALVQAEERLRDRSQALVSHPDAPPSPAPMTVPAATPAALSVASLAPAPLAAPSSTPIPQAPHAPEAGTTPVATTSAAMAHQVPPATPRIRNRLVLDTLKIHNQDLHVFIRVLVDESGRGVKAILQSGDPHLPEFHEAAMKAALLSTYRAALQNGEPTKGWVTVDYNFQKPWMQ